MSDFTQVTVDKEVVLLRAEQQKAGMKPYTDFSINTLTHDPTVYKLKGGRKCKTKCNLTECSDLIISFDIEVTSFFLADNGDYAAYKPGTPESWFKGRMHGAIPYIWMCRVGDETYYGRDLFSFVKFLSVFAKLENRKYIIWVHNLSYEFRFLSNILIWEQVFCRDGSSVMKAVSSFAKNVEFRCSYMLSTLSLAAWGKDIGLSKLTGDLDYNVMRTPATILTTEEYGYCRRDVEVVSEGIKSYLKQYGHLNDIPLTGTGEVRRIFKKICKENKHLQNFFKKLVPSSEMYCMLKEAFAGGYTHANEIYANRSLRGIHGYHFDFTSWYPTMMVTKKFPSTPFQECDVNEKLDCNEFAYLIRLRVYKLKAKCSMHYISSSKCMSIDTIVGMTKSAGVNGLTLDNGRVVDNIGGDVFDMVITEQDYDIIMKSYDIDCEIVELHKSHKAYLPKEYIEAILDLYANKTQYKGVDGKEEIYAQSKRYLNGVYGCFVMKLVDTECEFDNNSKTFTKNELDYFTIAEKIDEVKEQKYGVWNSYAQGVWITAYARHGLWECVLQNPDNVIYCDTDSIFTYEYDDFTSFNTKIIKECEDMCTYHGIDISRTRPRTPKGVEKPIGIFDLEDEFNEFKTLGAKRYVYRPSTGKHAGELVLTVSGINKGAVAVLEDDIDNFHNEMVFDKDHPAVHRNIVKYFYGNEPVLLQEGEYDEYLCDVPNGVNIRPTGYTMGADSFISYLNTLEDYSEYFDMLTEDTSILKSFDNNFRE